MSLTRLTAAALLPVAVLGSGLFIPDDNRMVQEDGLIRYPIVPKHGGSPFGKHSNATKRQIGTDSFAKRSGTAYIIELTLGTPGQTVPVQFDTGSSELWVNPVCSKSTTPAFCDAQPRFTTSTTLVDLKAQGSVTYGTGYANFEYMADYVAIGSAKITQQIFGVAYDTAHAVVGIMGAGPSLYGWDNDYLLPIDSLADQGLINSRAFSMDLRGFDSDRGSVIFGGLDVKKYSGNLVKRPIIPAAESPDGLTRYWVYLNGISVNKPDGSVAEVYTTPAGSQGQGVLLDSGYTLSALPSPIFQKLVAAYPSAEFVADAGLYVVDCLDPGLGGSLDFTFGDKVINVRYYDFVWHVPDSGNLCVLGAFEDDFPVLGDTFLRAAYVVYDQDNREIWLGQSEDCGTELVPIGSGPNAVPIIEGKCGQTQTSTTSTVSSTSSTSSTSTSTTSTPETSTTSISMSSTSTTVSKTSTTSSDDVSSTTVSETSTTSTDDASTSTTVSETSTSTEESSTTVSKTSTSTDEGSTSTTASETATSTSETVSESGSSSTAASTTSTTAASITSATRTKTTITQTSTRTYTITSCPPTVTHCPANKVTTEVVTITTAVCPETTGTFTIHKTVSCSAGEAGCPSGGSKTEAVTVTVTPLPPTERTTHVVPACTSGAPGPSACAQCGPGSKPTTLAVALPTATLKCSAPGCPAGNATVTTGGAPKPTKIVTAGAARAGWASAVFAVVGGAVMVALL
ncbi:aspartic peptidase domain-containing protein [Staphylotrichum tortipilum]|uniref:Aspartic peptidase domain-containing protein n=1 Tax=Staphylotrichum tortipilum TaxID=2831512 RepID=A0AAN6MT26_9PEZI|nr:aspartic peptidase domain-containing protein [Staphylotrichum longicolle]